jgi:hypothetical protein
MVLVPVLLLVLGTGPADGPNRSGAIQDLLSSEDAFDQIVKNITLATLADRVSERWGVDLCLHPDTDPAIAEELLRNLPTYLGTEGLLGYNRADRWLNTATDGATGTRGDPINLTWSIVPDGTSCDGAPSDLQAVFNAAWGSEGWKNKIRNAFDRWEVAVGISYTEVSDDGASLPGSPGSLGNRGDCRIGGRSIDGAGNVLGYNYYPDLGDMVLDTDDVGFYSNPVGNYANLKNVVSHEHGHGIGLGHVIPDDDTKLMEPYVCQPGDFVGPQDDDIRGGMRNYGDPLENNDTNADPSDLGAVSDSLIVENMSIDCGPDEDWYLVNLPAGGLTIEIDPVGSGYMVGPEGGTPIWTATDSISDPDVELYNAAGTTLLASATSGSYQDTEILEYDITSAGDYQIKIFRKAGTGNNVQRYTMSIYMDDQSGIPYASGESGLAFSAYPNPFSSQTTARFYAPAAGSYTVEMFDVSGRRARRVQGSAGGAGWVNVALDGRDSRGARLSSGLYFVRVTTADQVDTGRVLLVR